MFPRKKNTETLVCGLDFDLLVMLNPYPSTGAPDTSIAMVLLPGRRVVEEALLFLRIK